MSEFNNKFTKNESIVLFIITCAIFCFIIIPAINGSEPNSVVFIVIWIVTAVFILSKIKKDFDCVVDKYLPYIYEDLKLRYGEPAKSFKVRLTDLGELHFKGFNATFDVYKRGLLVSFQKRACYIENFKNIELSQSFIWGYEVKIKYDNAEIRCYLSKIDYVYLSKIMEDKDNYRG